MGDKYMDIAGLSMDLSLMNVQSQVSVAVLGNSLDNMEVMGDSMRKMLETSVTPNLGQNIDISI